MIFYGKEIWFKENVAMREKLFQIQKTGLLAIAKTYKTVSTFALNLLTGCTPIDITIKEENEIWQQQQEIKKLENIGIFFNFDYATEVSPWKINSIPWRTFNEKNYIGINVLTDGSKINNRVGCAMVVFEDGNEKEHEI
ncbi:hypothetical protein AVEN_216669-1 [Araneus ventricosus]|uniref:RNase H type-1 domain-containing protein n=1 Tax=Araneus ventricosus TaxID=182803 RepID=A0A4Y2DTR7_ARAVE|nr:hypothetical protein AVEN_216669-1 [Araneus ventricosus]